MTKKFSLSGRLSLLCAAGMLGAGTAHAQIVTNSEALDSLAGSTPPAAATTPQPRARHTVPRTTQHPRAAQPSAAKTTPAAATPATTVPAAPATQPQAAPATVAQPTANPASATSSSTTQAQTPNVPPAGQPVRPPPAPTIPDAPPSQPQLTPAPSDVEVHPFPIPPQPVVQVQAQGTVTPIPGGVRLTFAPGSADLNPETHQAILAFGQNLAYKPHVRALVNAFSSGAPDDPSLPRRMALARGLAARSVLMNGGTPSTRIYVRVIGLPQNTKAGEPEDYIDIYQSDAEP